MLSNLDLDGTGLHISSCCYILDAAWNHHGLFRTLLELLGGGLGVTVAAWEFENETKTIMGETKGCGAKKCPKGGPVPPRGGAWAPKGG